MPPRRRGASTRTLSLDLTQQLVDYGAYHSKPLNQLIHFVFVPLIALSLCVWLAQASPAVAPLPLPPSLPPALRAAATPNAALAAVAAYAAYYVALDPVAGLSWTAAIGIPTWLAATHWAATRPTTAAREAAAAHAASWAAQVVLGHGLVEGRRPALVDSLAQSLVLAPLFAWCEFLFAVGYRPALKRAVDAGVAAELGRKMGARTTRSMKRRA